MKRLALVLSVMLICGAAAPDEAADETKWYDRFDLSGLFYLTYEDGEFAGEDYSRFFIRRAYLTVETDVLPYLSARVTFDTAQDLEGQGRGDMEVRLKYAFAKFHWQDRGMLNDPNLEAGIVHMVWLDFEEHINLYRMRGPMFMERSGIFNSADFGVTFASGLGEDMDDAFRSYAGNKYGTRHGSMAVGVYNGSGYHGDERNVGKTVEIRLAWRPLPDLVRGLQVAGMIIHGDGNQEEMSGEVPDWRTYNAFLAYQFDRGTVTAQYVDGRGNQKGNWVEPDDPTQSTDYSGWAVFGEWRLGNRDQWRLTGGWDDFDRVADIGTDHSFTYAHLGLGYDFGKENVLILDLSQRDWDEDARACDSQVQLVMQLKF